MTLLDKFKEDHPDTDPDEAVFAFCPEDFGYTRPHEECCLAAGYSMSACEHCWAQEYRKEAAADGV